MGYKILNIDPDVKAQFTERQGLEGPFFYEGTEVRNYVASEGS